MERQGWIVQLWGESENELQMTGGLRLITPTSRGHSRRENPKSHLPTLDATEVGVRRHAYL